MSEQAIEKIRRVRLDVLGLLEGLPIPPRQPSGGATWESCQRDSVENEENLRPLRVSYCQRFLAVLEDDWVAVQRTLEDRKAGMLARLNAIRLDILSHTDPAKKYECWLEPRDGRFRANIQLEDRIEKLADELNHAAKSVEEDDLKTVEAQAPAPYRSIIWVWRHLRTHPKIVVAGIAAMLVSPFLWRLLSPAERPPAKHEPPTKYLSVAPNTHKTPLYARTKTLTDQRTDYLLKEKIDPWLIMGSSQRSITLHDGHVFGYYGLEYDGTVVDVFWQKLIDPFLTDEIQKVLDDIGNDCRANGVDATTPLDEAGSLLKGMVQRVYARMASVDQRLRTKGHPEKAPRRDVRWEIDRMEQMVDGQLKAAKALYSASGPPAR
jgi:hypothetical protein